MKLATYGIEDRQTFGVVKDDSVTDAPASWPGGPKTLLDALAGGNDALQRIAAEAASAPAIPLAEVRLLAPLPAPPELMGLAVNYVAHHQETSSDRFPDHPSRRTTPRPFLMPTTAVSHPGDTVPWPDTSEEIDYEVELAVVIGKTARRLAPDEAADCIAGYTIANDVSARSATFAAGRAERPKDAFFDWLHGKWADGFCPMGPWLVTADEVPDPQDLRLQCTVNGEVRQQASTGQMIFDVFKIVSFCSHLMTLTPGDVIATGTPAGVGRATGKLLKAGDVVVSTIEGIGELTYTLGPRPKEFYRPCQG